MENFLAAQAEAERFLRVLPGLLLGAATAMLAMLAARALIRAVVISCLGQEEGKLICGLLEMLVVVLAITQFYQQPGVLLTLLGWCAGLAGTLLVRYCKLL
ncbi:hypothetical protein MGLY_35560 (plasmid) [Neomoorella glycerini]|uniref:Uncharacterized protein n=1 Tax=Neomoorella glycerini TaxID=55779 RepID=A0A6I5ZXW3_9FIRM|nr:hypothetical protein [Moorella glycerini]QGP94131.1 hypothetical protein MGLY_35560 [Moorella glycerini]